VTKGLYRRWDPARYIRICLFAGGRGGVTPPLQMDAFFGVSAFELSFRGDFAAVEQAKRKAEAMRQEWDQCVQRETIASLVMKYEAMAV